MYHSFVNWLNNRVLQRKMNKIGKKEGKMNRKLCTITFLHYLCIRIMNYLVGRVYISVSL